MNEIKNGWTEKGHEPESPPPFFTGPPREILKRRFSWEEVNPGDRLVLTVLDALTGESGEFCFEILGKRKRQEGIGHEILVRFVSGSDEFNFYTTEASCTIPLGSEGLIGVCADIIKGRKTMVDLGGMSLGRDLAFEEVENLPEEAGGYCIAHQILDGHHFVPDQPPEVTEEEIEEMFSLWDSKRRAREVINNILEIQERLEEEEGSLRLEVEEISDLEEYPDFVLRSSDPEVEKTGLALYRTSLSGVYYQKEWQRDRINHRLVIRSLEG